MSLLYGSDAKASENAEIFVYEVRTIEIETTIQERKSEIGEVLEKEIHPQGNNCVFFVKKKLKSAKSELSQDKKTTLPFGLTTLKSKVELINTNVPHVGDVVITDESKWGHLALVLEVRDDSIVIEEGNYIHGYRTVRVISKDFPLGYRT